MKLVQKQSFGKQSGRRQSVKISYLSFDGRPCSVSEWLLDRPLRDARAAGDFKKLYQLRKQIKR